jgi:hypothetical protein
VFVHEQFDYSNALTILNGKRHGYLYLQKPEVKMDKET